MDVIEHENAFISLRCMKIFSLLYGIFSIDTRALMLSLNVRHMATIFLNPEFVRVSGFILLFGDGFTHFNDMLLSVIIYGFLNALPSRLACVWGKIGIGPRCCDDVISQLEVFFMWSHNWLIFETFLSLFTLFSDRSCEVFSWKNW